MQKYVIITAARNEEKYIEETIKSVIKQTILPLIWVIVSDGSDDNTDTIVEKYVKKYKWIKLIKLPKKDERNFASKVLAVKAGENSISNLTYDFIVNLDSDISFDEAFFEFLLDKFKTLPDLGIAGTDYIEGNFHSYRDSYISDEHVNGQCQMFRIECWKEIGGYTPIKGGGIDTIAVRSARMKGWKTKSFSDKTFNHLKPMGTAGGNIISSRFNAGRKDYILGGHPVWQIFRGIFNLTKKPIILGGIAIIAGYYYMWLTRKTVPIDKELVRFHRKEQIARLKEILINILLRQEKRTNVSI